MTDERQERRAGIPAFYLGLLLGAVLIAAFVKISSGVMERRAIKKHSYNVELLDHIDAGHVKTAGVRAVYLGNSRMRYALEYGLREDTITQVYKNKAFYILGYAWDAVRFGHYAELWPHILAKQPDFIIIQDIILTAHRAEATLLTSVSDSLAALAGYVVKRETARQEWERLRQGFDVPCPDQFTSAKVQDYINHVAARDRHRLKDNPHLDKARTLIAKAREKKIPVIILHVPGYVKMLQAYGLAPHQLDVYGLEAQPAHEDLLPDQHEDVIWMDYTPPPEYSSSFCDLAHFDEQGRHAFSVWFLEQLDRLHRLPPTERRRMGGPHSIQAP